MMSNCSTILSISCIAIVLCLMKIFSIFLWLEMVKLNGNYMEQVLSLLSAIS